MRRPRRRNRPGRDAPPRDHVQAAPHSLVTNWDGQTSLMRLRVTPELAAQLERDGLCVIAKPPDEAA
jgi:hypothetical protein